MEAEELDHPDPPVAQDALETTSALVSDSFHKDGRCILLGQPRPEYASMLALGTSTKLSAADKLRFSSTANILFVAIRTKKTISNFCALHKLILETSKANGLVSLIPSGTSYFVAIYKDNISYISAKKASTITGSMAYQ